MDIRAFTWAEGKESFKEGMGISDNPFTPRSLAFHDWRCGWLCAAFELSWGLQ